MNVESRSIALENLTLSQTPAQIERRAHLNKTKLSELAGTIVAHGLVHPILVRPFQNGALSARERFEIVAGERRYLAAKQAKLKEIPCTVRELTDEQAIEVQLIENLGREDLHPLAEAEGYEALQKRGHSVEQMSDQVGKSKGTIYARMKLLALCKDGRTAFYAGEIDLSKALLIARIPGDDQQQRALKHVTEKDWHDQPMSYREAQRYVHETFMLQLSKAPFPREDATLVPNAGPCSSCPMRTGNAPDLFGDVKGADVCTNPTCYQAKKAAHVTRELEKAKETGERIIRGGAARRILPDPRGFWYSSTGEHKQLRNGYARPRDTCLSDPKKRTYAELAGKGAPVVLLQHPDTGRVEKVFKVEAIADRLKAKGLTPPKPAENRDTQRRQDNEQRAREIEIELTARRAIFAAILKTAPAKLSRSGLADIVGCLFDTGYGSDDEIYKALGWPAPKAKAKGRHAGRQAFVALLRKLSDAELARTALAMTVISDVTETYDNGRELEDLAKRLGVDCKKIRAETKVAAEPVPAKKKTKSKGKANA